MKNKHAFTLIEVMVVLSILAIIAILAYNFFGSTMKEATDKADAIEAHKALVATGQAAELYMAEHNTVPATNNNTALIDNLIADGKLNSIDGGLLPESYFSGTPGVSTRTLRYNTGLGGGCASEAYSIEVIYSADIITDAACAKFNGQFATSIGERVWRRTSNGGTDPTTHPEAELVYCYSPQAAADRCIMVNKLNCNAP